jgi:hypothetical protein
MDLLEHEMDRWIRFQFASLVLAVVLLLSLVPWVIRYW